MKRLGQLDGNIFWAALAFELVALVLAGLSRPPMNAADGWIMAARLADVRAYSDSQLRDTLEVNRTLDPEVAVLIQAELTRRGAQPAQPLALPFS